MKINVNLNREQILNLFPETSINSVAGQVLENLIETKLESEKPKFGNGINFNIFDALEVVRKFPLRDGADKIPAIKALRQFASEYGVHIGLGEAKRFVENC